MEIDKKKLDEITRWFNKSGLSSATIEYSANGDFKLVLQKEAKESHDPRNHSAMHFVAPPAFHHPQGQGTAAENSSQDKESTEKSEKTESAEKTEKLAAPIVGTFYRAAGPDTPPFVQSGDKVKKGQVLCILEAMKIMNEFEAEFDMEIVSVLVENSQLVEFGQAIFEVKAL